jgi:glycogen synthase
MAVISGLLHQARTVLTLHNSFDAPFPASVQRRFFGKALNVDTMLQCSLPLLNGPLIAVSTPFARELSCDPLQKVVFADHLQKMFAMNPPLGIENGIFGEDRRPFTPEALALAGAGKYEKLIVRKNTFKRRFVKALKRTRDHRIIGTITLPEDDTATPVFFLAGRLDFKQKGFDIMFHAFARLKRGRAKLFFCPSSMDANSADALEFFREIADSCAGDVEIWPFKIQKRVYDLFLKGASYLLMPSIYEPFGSANEGLLSGTPLVARATGGLWVQVNSATPVKVPSFYGMMGLDNTKGPPTGILYREADGDEETGIAWRNLLDLPVREREGLPLYESLVNAAHGGLKNAISLYSRPEKYARLLVNCVKEVQKFSWDKAAGKYRQLYDVATNRGM